MRLRIADWFWNQFWIERVEVQRRGWGTPLAVFFWRTHFKGESAPDRKV